MSVCSKLYEVFVIVHVFEKPFKDLYITVDRYIKLLSRVVIFKILIKVSHVLEKNDSLYFKFLFNFSDLVIYINDNTISHINERLL